METISIHGLPQEASFERFGGGEAKLEALTASNVNDADIQLITEICNQPAVKKWVTFQYATGTDGRYTPEDARNFSETADQGWKTGAAFTYLVRDNNNGIVGAVGVKSPPGEEPAEIGYWSDTEAGVRGYMTNAVKTVCKLARASGYKSLSAYVMPENNPSKKLLEQLGFKNNGLVIRPEDDRELLMFSKELTESYENNKHQTAG